MFELAFPWIFLALPLPFLLWYFLPKAPFQLPSSLKIPFYNQLIQPVEQSNRMTEQTKLFIPITIWILLLMAISGPRWVGNPLPVERESRNIMMALDLSGSMELEDLLWKGRPATRLDIVKHAAIQFIKDRKTDKIGLILFGTQAYLQTPLTYDHRSLLTRIEDATVGLAGKTTSIGDALGLAIKRLQSVPNKGRVIILLTDGVNNSGILAPLKAAELAASDGIKIYTIGLGADPGQQPDNLFLALNASAELDEETLKEVAKISGGQYFRATDGESLQKVYKRINQLETSPQEMETIRPQYDYYHWPLALAFLLLLSWLTHIFNLLNLRSLLPFKSSARGEHVY